LPKITSGTTNTSGDLIITGINHNNQEVIVKYNVDNWTFEVIDPLGYHYFFESIEISDPFRSQASPYNGTSNLSREDDVRSIVGIVTDRSKIRNSVTSWHLDRITSPNNRALFFEYEDGLYFTYPKYSHSHSLNPNGSQNPVVFEQSRRYASTELQIDCNISVMKTKYLTRIHGDFGEILFGLSNRIDLYSWEAHRDAIAPVNPNALPNLGTNQQKLSSITVNNQLGQTIKTASLNYSYFNSDHNNDLEREKNLRLKLDEVLVDDQRYTFEYEQPNALPEKDSPSVDFWGFYNGEVNMYNSPQGNLKLRIPTMGRFVRGTTVTGSFTDRYMIYEGANRRSDFTFGKIGLLTKITYPTQGYSVFEYEGNRATVETPTNFIENYFNSTDYKFNYQYLERANLQAQQATTFTGSGQFTITGSGTIPFSQNFRVNLTLRCEFNCGGAENQPVVVITNVNTGAVYVPVSDFGLPLNYGMTPSQNNNSIEVEGTLSLPNGTYQLSFPQYNNSNSGQIVAVSSLNYNAQILDVPPVPSFPNLREYEVGGSRIKNVTNYGVNDEFINKKTYDYTQERFGTPMASGRLMDELIFHSKSGYFDYSPENYNASNINLSSSPQLRGPGSHIGYDKVTERIVNASGIANGRKECFYFNTPNIHYTRFIGNTPADGWYNYNLGLGGQRFVNYGNAYYLGITPDSFDHINGSMKEEILYNTDNEKVQQTSYTYTTEAIATIPTWKMYYASINIPHYLRYHLFGKKALLTQTTTQTFFDDNVISSTTSNEYLGNGHLWPTRTININSEGEYITKRIKYPSESILANMTELVAQNRRATPVEIKGIKDGRLLGEHITHYALKEGIYQPITIETKKETSDDFTERVEFISYDEYGNLLEYRQTDGAIGSYIWGYNKLHPIAKIENASYQEIATALEISVATLKTYNESNLNAIDSLRTDMPDAMISTYTYKPLLGVETMTDPRGYTMTYEYDNSQRLKRIRDAEGNIISENDYHYQGQN